MVVIRNVKKKWPDNTIYVDSETVKCSGVNNDHPLVYLKIPKGGVAVCGYCDLKFRQKNKE